MPKAYGRFGSIEVTEMKNGNLRLCCINKEYQEELMQLIEDNGIVAAELEVLEPMLANGFTYIPPIEIGGLTDGTIIGWDVSIEDDGTYDINNATLWWDESYAIRSFVDTLAEEGCCVLERA